MGVGQRVAAKAAHVGGVVVAGGSGRIRDVLVPVYEALDLPWDPRTAGSVEDEVRGATYETVEQAIRAQFAVRYELVEDTLSAETLRLAEQLLPYHDLATADIASPFAGVRL